MTEPKIMKNIQITPVTYEEIDIVADICVDAMRENPGYLMVFPHIQPGIPLQDALKWLFRKRILLMLNANALCYKLTAEDESGESIILGCGTAISPDSRPTLLGKIRIGLLTWPFLWGLESFSIVLSVDSIIGSCPENAWELAMIAVRSDYQGHGIGSKIVQHLLNQIESSQKGKSSPHVWLTTQKEMNLRFYARFGFKEVEHRRVDHCGGFSSWIMEKTS